jgi:hypothetical protein
VLPTGVCPRKAPEDGELVGVELAVAVFVPGPEQREVELGRDAVELPAAELGGAAAGGVDSRGVGRRGVVGLDALR